MCELEILHQCGKRVKLKFRKFWGLVPRFVEVTGEKLIGEGAPPILNRLLYFY